MGVHTAIPSLAKAPGNLQRRVDPEQLANVLEEVCQAGCKVVLEKISALEAGNIPAEFIGLCTEGRSQALRELKSIMAVYGDVCRL